MPGEGVLVSRRSASLLGLTSISGRALRPGQSRRGEGRRRGPALQKPQTLLLGGGQVPVEFPKWLNGCWVSQPELVGVDFPVGKQFINKNVPGVTKASIVQAADIGKSTDQQPVHRLRFFSTTEEGTVVEDLSYNITSSMDAMLGENTVQEVRFDEKNPRRLSVLFTTRRSDGDGRDARKAELFQNFGRSATDGESFFQCERLWRQVSQAKNGGYVYDYDILDTYEKLESGDVLMNRYISAFLQSQDPKYFDVGEKAVAIYKFSGTMAAVDCSNG